MVVRVSILFLVLCLFGPSLAEEPALKIETGSLQQNSMDNSRLNRGFRNDTSIRCGLRLTNSKVGRIKDVRVEANFLGAKKEILHRDSLIVPVIGSKESTDVSLFWQNPASVWVDSVQGVIRYKTEEGEQQIPFLVEPGAHKSPADSYNGR